ncbi:MAG: hypothetical protein U0841_14020 [Chloroflexia bacterium]
MLLALLPPLVVGAAVPAGEEAAPGPTGAATFGGVQYLFARRGMGRCGCGGWGLVRRVVAARWGDGCAACRCE